MEIIFFIFELLFEFLFSLMGAFIGVVWPPKSEEWAFWQRWGMGLGAVAVLSLGGALLIDWLTEKSVLVFPLSILGVLCLVGFAIVGNICRQYHEGR